MLAGVLARGAAEGRRSRWRRNASIAPLLEKYGDLSPPVKRFANSGLSRNSR